MTVVARTTNLAQPGAFSAANPDLGLNKPGVWSYPRIANATMWVPPWVEWCGAIDMGELEAVIEELWP